MGGENMPEELLYEKSCGAVVYCQKDNDIKYLLHNQGTKVVQTEQRTK